MTHHVWTDAPLDKVEAALRAADILERVGFVEDGWSDTGVYDTVADLYGSESAGHAQRLAEQLRDAGYHVQITDEISREDALI